MAYNALLIDTDSVTPTTEADRVFRVADLKAARILAAGLAAGEAIPLYVRVGSENGSRATGGNAGVRNLPNADYKWAPLFRCGQPVVLTAESNEHLERIPGHYMVGAPGAAPVFAGDVNVSHDALERDYLYVDPYCAGSTPPCPPLAARGALTSW
jgi:hypothetical protein